MLVPVVQVGKMTMVVNQRRMVVPVSVRLASRGICAMVVAVVGVVHMPMLMLQRFVNMLMPVIFCQMEIQAHRHQ